MWHSGCIMPGGKREFIREGAGGNAVTAVSFRACTSWTWCPVTALWRQSWWAQTRHPLQDAGIRPPAQFCEHFSRCFADIHEFYDFTLRSAPLQPPGPDAHCSTARQQHGAGKPGSSDTPREPQNLPEVRAIPARCCGAGLCTPAPRDRLGISSHARSMQAGDAR